MPFPTIESFQHLLNNPPYPAPHGYKWIRSINGWRLVANIVQTQQQQTSVPPVTPPVLSDDTGMRTGNGNSGTNSGFLGLGIDNMTLLLIGGAIIAIIYFIKKK